MLNTPSMAFSHALNLCVCLPRRLRLLFPGDSDEVECVLTDEVVFVIVKLRRPNPCFMHAQTDDTLSGAFKTCLRQRLSARVACQPVSFSDVVGSLLVSMESHGSGRMKMVSRLVTRAVQHRSMKAVRIIRMLAPPPGAKPPSPGVLARSLQSGA